MGKVLVVDDSASIRNLVGIALRGAGYEVVEACDGKDALSKLNGQKIHLVLTDINMPGMDGIELTQAIKNLPAYKFTPICMLTTESGQDKMEQGKAAGAKAWIVKPFQAPKLLAVVEKLLG